MGEETEAIHDLRIWGVISKLCYKKKDEREEIKEKGKKGKKEKGEKKGAPPIGLLRKKIAIPWVTLVYRENLSKFFS